MLPVAGLGARSGDTGWNRPVLIESAPRTGERVPAIRGIRTARWFYTKWVTGAEELYDVRKDPAERHNLAGKARYAEVLEQMRRLLAEVKDCRGAACNPSLRPTPE